ncbi:MAG: hypothetical protein ACU84H_11855 [Gammaproteobacteria bacterium]
MTCDHMKALDLARAGKWDEAHQLVQHYFDPLSCRIHAYLHREEGDMGNAGYWYRRAGVEMPGSSLQDELKELYETVEKDSHR